MHIIIRDWNKHFEADRSKQWKNIRWVPIPNKQGAGYRKIMAQKNGLEIFACWISLVQQGSLCNPRGDLSKYSIDDLSLLTLIKKESLEKSIKYLSEVLDWIEVIDDLDINVNDIDKTVSDTAVGSSILSSSILSSTSNKFIEPSFEDFEKYCSENNHKGIAVRAFKGYSEANWHDSKGKKIKNWKQKLQHVWFKDENKDKDVGINWQ